jgi:hypothetical protein
MVRRCSSSRARRSSFSRLHDTPASSLKNSERGYSIMELVIVACIILIIVSVSVFAFASARKVYGSDEAAAQVHRFMRDAATRAMTHRQRARVYINTGTAPSTVSNATPAISCPAQSIMLIDENGASTGDEKLVRYETLYSPKLIKIATPANLLTGSSTVPAVPYNYSAATFPSGVWQAYFTASGQVTDVAGMPLSATMYFYNPSTTNSNNAATLPLVRALTVFGPTGNVRFWRYNPTSGTTATWVGR